MHDRAEHTTKSRNAEGTREAIVEAARQVFGANGYDGAGTREIAAKAGCNVALINRYFGGKAGLFREVMEHCIDLSALSDVPPQGLPSALAEIALGKDPASAFDPLFMVLRSASSKEAQDIIKEQFGNPMVLALADLLEGSDCEARAAMALSIIAGFDVSRHMIAPDALGTDHDDALRPRLIAALRSVLES